MAILERFAHRFLFLKLLSASLALGALYDLAVAGLLAAAPGLPARWLGLPLPGEGFYLGLLAVLLVMLAVFYLAAARDPGRLGIVVAVAGAGRLAAAVVLAAAASGRPDLAGLRPLAGAELGFAAAHAAFWLLAYR